MAGPLTTLLRGFELTQRAALHIRGVRSQLFQTPEGAIHALIADGTGDGDPILLVHGLGSCAIDFGGLLQELRTLAPRVIAIDLPGHGFSDFPASGMTRKAMEIALLAALDMALDVPHTVIGNSLGGLVAIRFANLRPNLVSRLVLASPAGARTSLAEFQALLGRFQFNSWKERREFMDNFIVGGAGRHPLMALGLSTRMSLPGVQGLIENSSEESMLSPAELASLNMPLFLFWGAEDDLLPKEHLAFYREYLPEHAEVVIPDGYGHAPFLDDNKGFVATIRPFIEAPLASGHQ